MLPANNSFNNNVLHQLITKFYSGSHNFDLKTTETLNNSVFPTALVAAVGACCRDTDADINNFTWSKQEEFLNATLNNPLFKKYPMKSDFVTLFLKKLIGHLENSQDVHDDLYKYLCMIINDEPDKFNYRHYIIGNNLSNIITLKETNNLVLNGTTGMRTWQAALILADWALCNKALFRDKKITELGSGMGFAGITLAKFCQPKAMFLTDCHEDVLNTLEENININFNYPHRQSSVVDGVLFEEENLTLGVINLDWNNFNGLSFEMNPDIIIGADIVYDPSILRPLCDVIKTFLNKKKDIAVYIAGVLRNEDTFNMFLKSLDNMSLSYEKLNLAENVYIDWNRENQHYLLKISS